MTYQQFIIYVSFCIISGPVHMVLGTKDTLPNTTPYMCIVQGCKLTIVHPARVTQPQSHY